MSADATEKSAARETMVDVNFIVKMWLENVCLTDELVMRMLLRLGAFIFEESTRSCARAAK